MIVSHDPCEPITAEQRQVLRAMWPNIDRLTTAFALACDVTTCEALLRGDYVDPARLDQDWLAWARRQKFVSLATPASVIGVS